MEPLARHFDIPLEVAWGLLALIVTQLALQIAALVDLLRRPRELIRTGKKWIWVVVILAAEVLGPLIYFAAGRLPRPAFDPSAGEGVADKGRRAADVLYGPDPDQYGR